MLAEILKYNKEVSSKFDLEMYKIESVLRATEREYVINREKSAIKVLQESGTTSDLEFLYEEADKERAKSFKESIDGIIETIKKFFKDLKDKVLSLVRDKKNNEDVDAIEKKVKTFPLLNKKKVMVNDEEEEERIYDRAIKKLSALKAKIMGGVEVSSNEIDEVKDEYDHDRMKKIGVVAGVAITLGAAILLLKKNMSGASNKLNALESNTIEFSQNVDAYDKDGVLLNPTIRQKLVSVFAAITKSRASDFFSNMGNQIKTIKSTVTDYASTMGKTVVDAKDAVKTESVFDNDDIVLNYIFEAEEPVSLDDLEIDELVDMVDGEDDVVIKTMEPHKSSDDIDDLYERIVSKKMERCESGADGTEPIDTDDMSGMDEDDIKSEGEDAPDMGKAVDKMNSAMDDLDDVSDKMDKE